MVERKEDHNFAFFFFWGGGGGGGGLYIYTQKKKFSQYLCFLIKSTILHISLSFFYTSCIIVTLHLPVDLRDK